MVLRVEALQAFECGQAANGALGAINRHAARFVLRARDQMLRELDRIKPEAKVGRQPANAPDEILLRALLAAFPDRVIRRREAGSPRGLMVGGRGVRLAATSAARSAASTG